MARGATSHIEGMKEAREALQELAKATQTNIGKRALNAPADVFVFGIKARTPVSSDPRNPTKGSLRDAMRKGKSSVKKGSARLDLINDDIASVPNEFGTSKMAAQPFFRRGIDANREAAAMAMAEAIKMEVDVAVQRAARKGAKG